MCADYLKNDVLSHWTRYYLKNLTPNPNFDHFLTFFNEYNKLIKEPIVDFGCGEGDIVSFLSKIYLNVRGIDFSESAINLAVKRFPKLENNFFISNLQDVSFFNKEKVNTIISSMSLHHETTDFAKETLNRWDSILNENGLVYILTRSNLTIKDEKEVATNTYFMPKLNMLRVHFSKDVLKSIIPSSWKILELEELIYFGRSAKISSFYLVARKDNFSS
jgi:ubiquinone/menaquinone biosynthesis C-methylase UbiE